MYNKQHTLKDIKRVDARHVLHNLVGEEGIVEALSQKSVGLVHLDLCDETETHGQVQRVLIHDSPEEPAFKCNIYYRERNGKEPANGPW